MIFVQEFWKRSPSMPDIFFHRSLYYFAFTIKMYRINTDLYQYYEAINKQLEANNRIFDPVSFQVKGNITCDNDPKETVLGVFEVSSASLRTYSFSYFKGDKSVEFKEVEFLDMDKLLNDGQMYNQYPSFWIFN